MNSFGFVNKSIEQTFINTMLNCRYTIIYVFPELDLFDWSEWECWSSQLFFRWNVLESKWAFRMDMAFVLVFVFCKQVVFSSNNNSFIAYMVEVFSLFGWWFAVSLLVSWQSYSIYTLEPEIKYQVVKSVFFFYSRMASLMTYVTQNLLKICKFTKPIFYWFCQNMHSR